MGGRGGGEEVEKNKYQELSRRPWTSGFGSASGAEMASREEALIVQTLRWEAELPNRRLPWGA